MLRAGTEQQVTRFFAGCGALEKAPRILKDRATGRVIRGFVTFAEEQGLQNALQRDGHKLGGRNVSVTVATTHGTAQQDGTHTPAMASEVVDVLGARHSNGVFVDGTFRVGIFFPDSGRRCCRGRGGLSTFETDTRHIPPREEPCRSSRAHRSSHKK